MIVDVLSTEEAKWRRGAFEEASYDRDAKLVKLGEAIAFRFPAVAAHLHVSYDRHWSEEEGAEALIDWLAEEQARELGWTPVALSSKLIWNYGQIEYRGTARALLREKVKM